METIAKIRRLFHNEHRSIREISRDLRVSRKVVRKALRSDTTAFTYIRLCHSRFFLIRAYPRETQEMVFNAHERAFSFFGGGCGETTELAEP